MGSDNLEHPALPPPGLLKKDLRAWARQFRRSLSPAEVDLRGRLILQKLSEVPEFQAAAGVLTCVSFDNEPSTAALLEAPPEGKRLYVPRAVLLTRGLVIHPFPTPLVRSAFGIPEPAEDAPMVPSSQISEVVDVALVVGLAFGRNGLFRLGYGAGFLDRFLASHRVFAIGLSYDETLLPEIPHDEQDVPMDVVVTDKRVLRRGD